MRGNEGVTRGNEVFDTSVGLVPLPFAHVSGGVLAQNGEEVSLLRA